MSGRKGRVTRVNRVTASDGFAYTDLIRGRARAGQPLHHCVSAQWSAAVRHAPSMAACGRFPTASPQGGAIGLPRDRRAAEQSVDLALLLVAGLGAPDVEDQHHAVLAAVVPGLVLDGVVEDRSLPSSHSRISLPTRKRQSGARSAADGTPGGCCHAGVRGIRAPARSSENITVGELAMRGKGAAWTAAQVAGLRAMTSSDSGRFRTGTERSNPCCRPAGCHPCAGGWGRSGCRAETARAGGEDRRDLRPDGAGRGLDRRDPVEIGRVEILDLRQPGEIISRGFLHERALATGQDVERLLESRAGHLLRVDRALQVGLALRLKGPLAPPPRFPRDRARPANRREGARLSRQTQRWCRRSGRRYRRPLRRGNRPS